MTPTTTAQVLAYFATAWPYTVPDAAAAEVWTEACNDIADEVGQVACKRLLKSEERPPSIKRFRDECSKVAKDRQPALHAGTHEATTTRAEAAARVRAIRAGMAVAAKQIPQHRNHDKFGGANCPACSTRADRAHLADEVHRAIQSELNREETP